MSSQIHNEPIDGEVSALSRGLTVLRVIGDSPFPLTLKEISDGAGIPKATTSRLLNTLLTSGLVRRLPESERYRMGPGVMALSQSYLAKLDIRAESRSHMRSFAEATGVTVHLGTRDRLEMVLLETVRPMSAALVMRIGVGNRLGLATSASGRAYLAALPDEEREQLIHSLRVSMEGDWPNIAARLDIALAQYRAEGFVTSYGEWHPDVNAIAVPIVMPDGEIYSLNCGGAAFKFTAERLTEDISVRLLACMDAIRCATGGTIPSQALTCE